MMISLVKKIWNDSDRLCLKADEKCEALAINNEQPTKGGHGECAAKDAAAPKNAAHKQRKGVITAIDSEFGVIDNFIEFDVVKHARGIDGLCIGYQVAYTAHEQDGDVKVIKIDSVVEQYECDVFEDKHLSNQIDQLKSEAPQCFNKQKRKLMALIREVGSDEIIVESENDNKTLTVKLDDVEINYLPRLGDRVQLTCTVESDESFDAKRAEELQVVRVEPASMQNAQKRRVERVYEDFAVLDEDAYVLIEDVPSGTKLHIGDILKVELIACERNDFLWRCIQLNKLEKSFGLLMSIENTKLSKEADNEPMTISGEDNCILTAIGQKKIVTKNMRNNSKTTTFTILCVKFEKRGDTQLRLLEPNTTGFVLEPGAEIKLVFEVLAKFIGESTEYFTLKLEKFCIRKRINVVVTETPTEATEAERRLTAATLLTTKGRNQRQQQRNYAYEVWSRSMEVVPGEHITTQRRFVPKQLPKFPVPKNLCDVYLNSERPKERMLKVELLYPCMKETLSFANYAERFALFLHLEEIEVMVNFRNYDRERAHFVRDGEYLSLTIENLQERRPSLVVGDNVKAIDPMAAKSREARCFEGIVHKVLFNRVLLKFNAGFQESYKGEEYRLEFGYSRLNFIKQHHALRQIKGHLGERFLFPTKLHVRKHPQLEVRFDTDFKLQLHDTELKWYNPLLNSIQKRAVFNILRGEAENMPYAIFGPPGTGKTVTLVETILQLVHNLPSSRLLVGAPSNSAADLITQRLVESGVLKREDFMRLVSRNQVEKGLIPDSLKPYCATVDYAIDGTCEDSMVVTDSGLKLGCQMNDLRRVRVTISTCATLGNFLKMSFPSNHFSHVLIDEAGQCTEPESIEPITLVSKSHGQVVLAGDPQQLPAIVVNIYAADHGFSCSLMERIMACTPYKRNQNRFQEYSGFDPRLVTKLLYNYRSLPSIMSVYSELFYNSELMSTVSEDGSREAKLLSDLEPVLSTMAEKRLKTHAVFFHGIRSENMQEEDSPSWYNPGEAKSVFITTIKLYRAGIKPENIGIVTPYKKQVNHLRDMFIAIDIAMPKIGSVEEFQGQERDIILVSTVRSTESYVENDLRQCLGFVRCVKRMNVAISRARYLMIIFGNPYLLALDDCWYRLIKYAYDNGGYSGCELPQALFDESDDNSKRAVVVE